MDDLFNSIVKWIVIAFAVIIRIIFNNIFNDSFR